MRKFFSLLLAFAILACIPGSSKELAVVVNKANDTKSLSAVDLTKLLKNTTKQWDNGREAIIVIHRPGAPEMRILLQRIFAMSAEQLEKVSSTANQSRTVFLFADSDDVVLRLVADNPGAIGVMDVYAINSSVNVVKIEGKMPLEPGYLLHGVW